MRPQFNFQRLSTFLFYFNKLTNVQKCYQIQLFCAPTKRMFFLSLLAICFCAVCVHRMHSFLMSSHHLMEQSLSRCNHFIDEACWTHFSSNLVLWLIVPNAFQRFHFILISWQTFKNVYQNSVGCLCTNKKNVFRFSMPSVLFVTTFIQKIYLGPEVYKKKIASPQNWYTPNQPLFCFNRCGPTKIVHEKYTLFHWWLRCNLQFAICHSRNRKSGMFGSTNTW